MTFAAQQSRALDQSFQHFGHDVTLTDREGGSHAAKRVLLDIGRGGSAVPVRGARQMLGSAEIRTEDLPDHMAGGRLTTKAGQTYAVISALESDDGITVLGLGYPQ